MKEVIGFIGIYDPDGVILSIEPPSVALEIKAEGLSDTVEQAYSKHVSSYAYEPTRILEISVTKVIEPKLTFVEDSI